MLSATTVQMLEELAERSHLAYSEGGCIYTYTEAARQAHSLFPRKWGEPATMSLTALERTRLAIVIRETLGEYACSEANADSMVFSNDLLQQLQSDLEFTDIVLVLDDHDGYCWGATIHMKRETDNRYFSLYLWGSID